MSQQFTVWGFSPFTLCRNNEIPQRVLTDIPSFYWGVYGSQNLGEIAFFGRFWRVLMISIPGRNSYTHFFSDTITHDFESKVTGLPLNRPNTAITENMLPLSMAISSVRA